MSAETCPAEQLTSGPAVGLVDRDDGDQVKHPMQQRVSWDAAKHLSEGGRRRDYIGLASQGGLKALPCPRIALGELAEAFSVENQGAAYPCW